MLGALGSLSATICAIVCVAGCAASSVALSSESRRISLMFPQVVEDDQQIYADMKHIFRALKSYKKHADSSNIHDSRTIDFDDNDMSMVSC